MLPKKSTGDRIIGIAPMICRLWSLIREPHVRMWTKEVTASWGAAIAGNSSLRQAFPRAIHQEVPQHFGVACGEGLIDTGFLRCGWLGQAGHQCAGAPLSA
eukprot:5085645-Pyramimonas_sp.AAC.1